MILLCQAVASCLSGNGLYYSSLLIYFYPEQLPQVSIARLSYTFIENLHFVPK